MSHAPQYGDKTALDTFRKSTSPTPMTGTEAPIKGPGRPATGRAENGPPPGVPPDVYASFQALARAKKTAYFWQKLAKESPSPVTRFFNHHAQEAYKKAARSVYGSTPNFE